ncbi:FecR family protein [Sphingobacterium nematocida]|uniref:FecR family protein n=1 Tax=Sphingobacterium nematocida TaxID=1513896 RepID=A0A1T5D7C0_9SPHI|nr:FecR domain-containing protein [Sphingobacterium nematocida]SKB67569.1 FecR family protein [Sphingobacterium nematocida]
MYDKKHVFEQYLAGKCTPEQAAWLVATFSEETFRAELENYIDEVFEAELQNADHIEDLYVQSQDQYPIVEALIFGETQQPKIRSLATYWRWVAAAAALLIFYIGYKRIAMELLPATDKVELASTKGEEKSLSSDVVTLTLPNGEVIDLSDGTESRYATVEKQDGDSFFEIKKLQETKEPMIQTVQVPAGKTGTLLLTDGTKVWLNAGSKLTYDVNFIGGVRKVDLEGEAYFEVAKNKEKPFVVASDDQRIRVLGTHFNVKAYRENRTTTTLMEGSVEVATNTSAYTLKPGQSSMVTWGGADIKVEPAKMDKVNAWRNNEFAFYDATLDQIGRELSRWYGVDVQVVSRGRGYGFTGVISRNKDLEEVLDILNRTGQIRYHIIPVGIGERRVVLMI